MATRSTAGTTEAAKDPAKKGQEMPHPDELEALKRRLAGVDVFLVPEDLVAHFARLWPI